MDNLKEQVQKMLDGETKRRKIALAYLQELEEILIPVSNDIWGSGELFGDYSPTYTVTIEKIDKNGDKTDADIYFRYENHVGDSKIEYPGFYDKNSYPSMNAWGKPVEELKGNDFWYAIQVIINWIPQVIEIMEIKELSRDELLSKINVKDV